MLDLSTLLTVDQCDPLTIYPFINFLIDQKSERAAGAEEKQLIPLGGLIGKAIEDAREATVGKCLHTRHEEARY